MMALNKDIFELLVAESLGLADLARLQAADTGTKALLATSGAWCRSWVAELPSLHVAPELLEPTVRPKLLAALPSLTVAAYATDSHFHFASLEDVERLAKLVAGARRSAVAHAGSGCAPSAVVVGCLRVPAKAAGAVVLEGLGRGRGAAAGNDDDLSCSEPITFPVADELASALGVDGGALRLSFAWRKGGMEVQALAAGAAPGKRRTRGAGTAEERGGRLLVDLTVRDPALVLHQRGGAAQLGGAWRPMGPGLSSFNGGQAAAEAALVRGVPCVLLVREGTAQAGQPGGCQKLAHALHLDRMRRHSSR